MISQSAHSHTYTTRKEMVKRGYAYDPKMVWVKLANHYYIEFPKFWDDKPDSRAKLYEISIKEVEDNGRKPENDNR